MGDPFMVNSHLTPTCLRLNAGSKLSQNLTNPVININLLPF